MSTFGIHETQAHNATNHFSFFFSLSPSLLLVLLFINIGHLSKCITIMNENMGEKRRKVDEKNMKRERRTKNEEEEIIPQSISFECVCVKSASWFQWQIRRQTTTTTSTSIRTVIINWPSIHTIYLLLSRVFSCIMCIHKVRAHILLQAREFSAITGKDHLLFPCSASIIVVRFYVCTHEGNDKKYIIYKYGSMCVGYINSVGKGTEWNAQVIPKQIRM